MTRRRIAIIGGGPAGLYAARLLKTARPDWAVTVYERTQGSRETFGFGVVLTGSTLANLTEADPYSAADIRAVGHVGHSLRLMRGSQSIDLHGARNLAIARRSLLDVLTQHARAAGVEIEIGQRVDAAALDADIVIAADGVRSGTRSKLASELGADISVGRGRYLWCGTDFALENSLFSPARTEHGMFVAHAYPYAGNRSTFLIETGDATWRAAGMDDSDRATAPGGSDEYSLRYLQQAFAAELGGHRLLGNRSRWLPFHTVHLRRWSHGNTVLIGDAAHTAHYTLGSGTKLAMEDAIALSRALLDESDIATAFAAYEQARRPFVERFQRLAARSQRWWESFPLRLDRPLPTLALGFLTRTGNIELGRLGATSDQPLLDALSELHGEPLGELPHDPAGWVLDRPINVEGRCLASRVTDSAETLDRAAVIEWSGADPWNELGDATVDTLRNSAQRTALVRGADDLTAVQGRIDLAERLKLELNRTVIVQLPETARAEAAAAVACGRCDLVTFSAS